jgi:hypothetical protein
LVPSSAIFQRPVIVFPSSLKVAVKHLGERLALPPELPLAVADGHLVDAADAAFVGVQLEVRPVGRGATGARRGDGPANGGRLLAHRSESSTGSVDSQAGK